MPTVDLGGWPESSVLVAYFRVVGVMHYPNDPKLRDEMTDTELFLHDMVLNTGALSPVGRSLQKTSMRRWTPAHHGVIAGFILVMIRRIAETCPDIEASVNRAVYIMMKIQELAQLKGPKNTREILRAWSKFKKVSHFWAALALLNKIDVDQPPP